MKSLRQKYLDELKSDSNRIIDCIRIERMDGQIFRWTDHDEELVMDSFWDGSSVQNQSKVTYLPDQGDADRSAITLSSGVDSAVFDLTSALEPNGVTPEEIRAGKWDFSIVKAFRTIWDDPVEDDDPKLEGRFGEIKIQDFRFVVEVKSIMSLLETSIGRTHEPICQWDLGDSRCKVDLPSFEVSGTVEDIRDSGLTVEDSTRSEVDDFFGLGEFRVDTGENAGISRQIKDFSNGVFTLWQPFPFTLEVGESYRAVPGCRKRKEKDCRDKFDNVINHGGFADMPLEDDTSKFGEPRQ